MSSGHILSPTTAAKRKTTLRCFAKSIGTIPPDNWNKRVAAPKPNPYTKSDIEVMNRWAASSRSRARKLYLALGLGGGLKLEEMNDLKWNQIVGDGDSGLVLVDVAGRDVPMIDYFTDAIYEYREHSDEFVFPSTKAVSRKDYVISTVVPLDYKGLRITTTRMRDTWACLLLDAGVPAVCDSARPRCQQQNVATVHILG